MRVAFYTPNYPGLSGDGGIGSYTRAVSSALAAASHDVHVLTCGDAPPQRDGPVLVHGVRLGHFPVVEKLFPGAGPCWRIHQSMRLLSRYYRLDIVEFPNWEGYGLWHTKFARTPTVVRLHTSSAEAQAIDGTVQTWWNRWDVMRERWLAHHADALVTHSDAHRRAMSTELNLPVEQIEVIPHGLPVFPDFARPSRPDGPPTVVYLGRLEHRKGTVELLQAIPRVLRAVPDTRFVLIGSDRPHCPGGRTHAEYLEQEFPPAVRRHVTLAGRLPQADVDQWLQTADVFVAPSRYESFGLIFLEAMRWGTPVIGTTAGGIPEVVEDGESGLLVPPENPDALATAMIRLLGDAELRAKLGAAGRARAEQDFNVDLMAKRVEAFYASVIARWRRGRRGRRGGDAAA